MKYNWPEIFKNKSDKELYNIWLGKSLMGSEVIEFARIELERRNFNFKNLDKHLLKWELENLIEEEKSYTSPVFRLIRSREYIVMGFIGLLTTIIALVSLISYYFFHKPIGDLTGTSLALVTGTAFTIIGFFNYKRKRKREQFREKRIKELISKL